jgi:hypothetical protein
MCYWPLRKRLFFVLMDTSKEASLCVNAKRFFLSLRSERVLTNRLAKHVTGRQGFLPTCRSVLFLLVLVCECEAWSMIYYMLWACACFFPRLLANIENYRCFVCELGAWSMTLTCCERVHAFCLGFWPISRIIAVLCVNLGHEAWFIICCERVHACLFGLRSMSRFVAIFVRECETWYLHAVIVFCIHAYLGFHPTYEFVAFLCVLSVKHSV